MLKVASWNVNSLKVRLPQVVDWLASAQPDLLGLQETKTRDENFPLAAIESAGYQAIFTGQKTYNGVAILSHKQQPPVDIDTQLPGLDDPQRRLLAATYGTLRVINLYVPNGSAVGSEKFNYKLEWLDRLRLYLKEQLRQYDKLLVLGDFNIAPQDQDVYDPAAWVGSVLVSPAERQAFQALLDTGLVDTFRLFQQPNKTYSWWDYRAAAFPRNRGLRIDHVLANQSLAELCLESFVDKAPRKLERPSDHAPVFARFSL